MDAKVRRTGDGWKPVDARVVRTRERVLSAAHRIVEESGPGGLTYTRLAARSGVTRPTLYQHWPTLSVLLREMMHVDSPPGELPSYADAESALSAFLVQFRDAMEQGSAAPLLTALMGQAEHDARAAEQLDALTESRRTHLNRLLGGTRVDVGADDMAALVGPLLFRRFVDRRAITDAFIAELVAGFLSDRTG